MTARLPLSRRVVCEFLRAGRSAEPVTFERRMPLGEVRRARDDRPAPVLWSAVFLKALGAVANEFPELRRVVLNRPWMRIVEARDAVGALTLVKPHDGEELLLLAPVRNPARLPLVQLDAWIRRVREAPVGSVSAFRLALRVARLPLPLRCLATGLTNWVGPWRAKAFGTFGLSVTPGWGATALNLRSPWGCAFHYDLFEDDGHLRVRLTFDHRLLDGRRACQILEELERTLTGPIREELLDMSAAHTDTTVTRLLPH